MLSSEQRSIDEQSVRQCSQSVADVVADSVTDHSPRPALARISLSARRPPPPHPAGPAHRCFGGRLPIPPVRRSVDESARRRSIARDRAPPPRSAQRSANIRRPTDDAAAANIADRAGSVVAAVVNTRPTEWIRQDAAPPGRALARHHAASAVVGPSGVDSTRPTGNPPRHAIAVVATM